MTTVTVFKFLTAEGAVKMLSPLQRLQEHQLIQIEDTAIVSWPVGASQPTIRQISDLSASGVGTLSGAFWGMLFGLLFSLPLADTRTCTAVELLTGYLAHYGFNEDFFKQVRDQIVEGTSALFLIAEGASALFLLTNSTEAKGRIGGVKNMPSEIMSTNLSHRQKALLREAFGRERLVQ